MFARSVFQSVLERLKEEAETTEDRVSPAFGAQPRGLGAGFVVGGADGAGSAGADMVRRAYDAFALDEAATPPLCETAVGKADPPVMPAHLLRQSPEEIAADLGIAEQETPDSLAARRRAFAALNHPDRHPVDFHAEATRRMMIANMLIDEALRRLKRRAAG
ncbi:hypothetical protein SAMN05880582_1011404 [Rhizobium sp. RU20A]|uniref:hypothetical protein n=1 Tax=Rhizobium sp. RU20A TaxID=1907412 RepID=UPI000953D37A|nr:hypothetical protein [Rhizobium sp. RU20A]SIQ29795.1 hypothetical protein SAMN05880582_1011404 [Rhizobium sp. RU20A]